RRAPHRGALRGADPGGRQRLLERPDGCLRVRRLRRRHALRGRGGGIGARHHGRRRRRLGSGAQPVRARRRGDAPLDRWWRHARAGRGPRAAGRGSAGGVRVSRSPLIAGNWKMHKAVAEAEQLIQSLLPRVSTLDRVEIVICPPYTALAPMVESAWGSRVAVFAQNMHEAEQGAFTGEISAAMLVELGVSGVIVGHSERRAMFGETDARLSLKLPAALAAELTPILCVGESEAQR